MKLFISEHLRKYGSIVVNKVGVWNTDRQNSFWMENSRYYWNTKILHN